MGSTLHTAAANNHPLVIQAILLSVPKSQRLKLLKVRPFTPLRMAASCRLFLAVDVLMLMLSQEERIQLLDAKDQFGNLAVHWASSKGYTDISLRLLDFAKNIQSLKSYAEIARHTPPLGDAESQTEVRHLTAKCINDLQD